MRLVTLTRASLRATTAIVLAFGSSVAMAQSVDTTNVPNTKKATAADELLLGQITVYADREARNTQDVPASVSVISGQEIRDRGLNDMHELVRYTPGVEVNRQTTSTDPFSGYGGFTIRGVGGNRVQMLVDGARVPERITDGTRDYLDLAFTKQVEIIKGPASVLWGADALGGVVAVETIDPADILAGRTRGGIARMSHDTQNKGSTIATAFAQQFGPTLQVMAGIARTTANEARLSNARNDGGIYGCPRSTAYGATPCGELNPADINSTRTMLKAVWTPIDGHKFKFSFDQLKRTSDVDYNNVLGPTLSTVTGLPTGEVVHRYPRTMDTHRKTYGAEYVWSPGSGFVDEVKTRVTHSKGGYDRSGNKWSTSAAGQQIMAYDYLGYDENFTELDIQATSRFTTGTASHTVTWGFDGDRAKTDYERVTRTNNLTTGTQTEARAGGFNFANATTRRADIYAQDTISLLNDTLEITPGVRYATYKIDPRPNADYKTVEGKEPRERKQNKLLKSLSALYNVTPNTQVWAHYGEGFKMPTAQQLYTSVPGTFFDQIPAPDLTPEFVRSYELGLRQSFERGFVGVTAFNANYDDFIESFYNPPGTTDYTYRNLSKVHVWGVELSAAYVVTETVRINGALSWQKGTQQAEAGAANTPHTLPPLKTVVGVTWDVPEYDLSFDVIGTFANAIRNTSSQSNFKPAGYGLIDAFAHWTVNENAVVNVGVKNLFDKRYFEANAATYSQTASTSVAASNPLELQTGAGREFTASLDFKF